MIWSGVLRSRRRLLRNQLRPGRGRWASIVGFGLFAWFFTLVLTTLGVTFASLDPLGFGPAEGAAVLAAVMLAALVAALVFDLQHAVSATLLDSDLELLHRAPVTPRELLAIKLLDSLPRTGAMIVAVALPASLAFAFVMHTPWWGWALLPVLLAGLWAAPLGIGIAAALMILRAVPAARVREVLAVLSTLIMLSLWLVNSFAMPRLLTDEGDLAPRLIQSVTPASWFVTISPPHWAASALLAAHEAHPIAALGWTLRLVVIAASSLMLAAFAGRGLLEDVLARVASGEATAKRRHTATAVPMGSLRSLLIKDARLFTRDWSVLGDVLTAALLWTLLPLVAGPIAPMPAAHLVRFMMVALAIGLGYEVGARTIPYEGLALAWTRLSPLPAWRWNAAKWLGGALLSLPLMMIAALVSRFALSVDWLEWSEAVAAGLGALSFSLALGLWTGWTFGDPHWTQPRAMLTFPGRLIASGLLILQAIAWVGALSVAERIRDTLPSGALLWGPLALGLGLTVPMMWIVQRVARRYEWSA
jgi:hypothetical protein